jgi:hypothetical protein
MTTFLLLCFLCATVAESTFLGQASLNNALHRAIPQPLPGLKPSHLRRIALIEDASNPTAETRLNDYFPFIKEGVIDLDFNPAYVTFADFGGEHDLLVSSFYNVALNKDTIMGSSTNSTTQLPPFVPFEQDLVALISSLEDIPTNGQDVRILSKNTPIFWPNDIEAVPEGVFPFNALLVPQGWFLAPQPGRLSVLNIDTSEEYIIHQSTYDSPRFYHRAIFIDMDQDGHQDIVSARSGFMFLPPMRYSPPSGELVWFRNPGDALDKDTPWEEHVITMGLGPDVFLDATDLVSKKGQSLYTLGH